MPESKPFAPSLDKNHTTMTLPHRRIDDGRRRFYVATFPEGDLAIHEWSPTDQHGYNGAAVTFLLENGDFEVVRGPYNCAGAYDHGRSLYLEQKHGMVGKLPACRIVVGRGLAGLMNQGQVVICQEPVMACGDFRERLRLLIGGVELPVDFDVRIEHRGCHSYMSAKAVRELLDAEACLAGPENVG